MASPGNTIKTITLKKPLVVIKKESLSNPLILKALKRQNIQVPSSVPSPKRSCIAAVSAEQSTPKVSIQTIQVQSPKRSCVTVPAVQSTPKVSIQAIQLPSSVPRPKRSCAVTVPTAQSNPEVYIQTLEIPSSVPSPKRSCVTVSAVQSTPKVSKTKKAKPAAVVDSIDSLKKVTVLEKSKEAFILPDLAQRYDLTIKKHEFFTFKQESCAKFQRCAKHKNMKLLPEHVAEGLPQLWDMYDSVEEFVEHASMHAKSWFFYYTRFDSRNLKTRPGYNSKKPTYYHFQCTFNKKQYKSQSKGIRKPRDKLAVDCPAGLILRIAVGDDKCTVWDVCHHHSHELSAEVFGQLPHGKRLPQEIKDEIRDLALFNLDSLIVRRYIESKVPDLKLRRTVYNIFRKIKRKDSKETTNMPPERVKEILDKIKYIKANFNAGPQAAKEPECKQYIVGKYQKPKKQDKTKILKIENCTPTNISYDQEAVQSVEVLQMSCVTEVDPWVETTPDGNESDNAADEFYEAPIEDSTYSTDNIVPKTIPADKPMPSLEPILVDSEIKSEPITTTRILQYKIGDVTIQTARKPCILSNVREEKSKENVTQLCKLERTISEPEKEPVEVKTKKSKQLRPYYETVEMRCQRRHKKLPEHKAEGLVQVGDIFASANEFVRYTAAHALKWFFYYKVSDSRNAKTSPRYSSSRKSYYYYTCRFDNKCYKSRGTGRRKIKTTTNLCPATVSLVCMPGEEKFKALYVCHHHTHELSHAVFSRQAHGHRLSPELKDEIRELAWLGLDSRLIRIYLQNKTGHNDLKFTVKNSISKMKREGHILNLSPEKESLLLEKIEEIKKTFTIPKRAPPTKKIKTKEENQTKAPESEDEEIKSRVDIRLNNILHDQQLIQSVKELQESTGCEIRINTSGDMSVDMSVDNVNSNLQEGIIENTTKYEELPQGEIEVTESQIEVDQQLYSLDDNVQYIFDDGTVIYEAVDTTEICAENVCEEQVIDCDTNVPEASDNYETIIYEEQTIEPDENIYIDEVANANEENEQMEVYREADECSGNESENQSMYTNDEHSNIESSGSSGCSRNEQWNEDTFDVRDMGVQADLEIIELERDCERIKKLELTMLSEDTTPESKEISVNTRGRPKVVLDEGIISRFNIEFYISVGGIIPCLENLAISMNLSVLELLKKLYQGEAVFKMSLGRSGKQERKTVQLTYMPLTIPFPFEKFKYMNGLLEYKMMCSKYSDVVVKLENTVESMSTELNDTKEKFKFIESQNAEFLKVMKNYEQSVKTHNVTQELLKKCQEDLKVTETENQVLVEKVSNLEAFQQSSGPKDAGILKQLIQPTSEENIDIDKLKKENEALHELLKNPKANLTLIEKIKNLELTVETSDAEIKRYQEKIRKLEDMYLTDSQSLLDKIKGLEEELSLLRTNNSSSSIPKLRKEIKDLKEVKWSENKMLTDKIKKLCKTVSSLKKQLNDQTRENSEEEDSCSSTESDPLARFAHELDS